MSRRMGLEVSLAVSEAASACDVDVIAAYPITPQTHIVEHLSELVADGKLDAEFVPVESEHSALSACVGAAAAGARCFTSSASQGIALMHEILFIVPALRLPMVMAVANRALSAPINIWNDHSDVMAERDAGWISLFAENGQDAFDLTCIAFRISEDHAVQLPVMVNLDGFTLSHVIEPIELLSRDEVKKFLPDFVPAHRLDPARPLSMGLVGVPEVYTEARYVVEDAILKSPTVIAEAFEEWANHFGRRYDFVETYRTEDAETVLVTMGSTSETAMTAVDEMRQAGQKVGLARIRLWRPFPFEEFRRAVGGAKTLAVMDRCLPFGGQGGPVATELRSLYYAGGGGPRIVGFIAGLGGRDVRREDFAEMVDIAERPGSQKQLYHMIGLRVS
ncbi:MAG: pyruvate ferredoxin oxidoreductase [Proteobacteria bacterium]|nr:pyruvate ferredoxin oxidoreductase [Pseudomonadota bacterium]MBU1741751.1 pyruvate ferredoxin oxidoreductase [Pseudomonadota bacterium]